MCLPPAVLVIFFKALTCFCAGHLMHPGNLVAAAGRMQEALEALQLSWNVVREHWNDGMSHRFEEQHVRPIFERINIALPAMTQMAQALQAAQSQCGEPGERSGL